LNCPCLSRGSCGCLRHCSGWQHCCHSR